MSSIGQVTLRSDGSLELPQQVRETLDLSPGDVLTAEIVGDQLRLTSIKTSIRRVQEFVRQYNPDGRSLVDEMIAERRAEAARE